MYIYIYIFVRQRFYLASQNNIDNCHDVVDSHHRWCSIMTIFFSSSPIYQFWRDTQFLGMERLCLDFDMLMTGSTVFHGISTTLEIILYPLSNWQQGPSETTEKVWKNPVEASEVKVTFSNLCRLTMRVIYLKCTFLVGLLFYVQPDILPCQKYRKNVWKKRLLRKVAKINQTHFSCPCDKCLEVEQLGILSLCFHSVN